MDRIAYLRVFDDDGVEHIEKIEFGYRNGSVEEIECSFYCSTANIESDKMGDFMAGEWAFYETTYGELDNATVRSTHVMDYCIVQVVYKELNQPDYARAVLNTLECYSPGVGNAANGGDKISVPSSSNYPGWYIKQIPGI